MEFLFSFWQFFYANIFTKPQYFVGLIVLVGYLLLGRKWYDALAGFIKAVVGYMILNVAAGGLVSNFRPVLAALGIVSDYKLLLLTHTSVKLLQKLH